MAKSLTINGVTYPDVPYVDIPQQGGGSAAFYDISDATISGNAQLLSGVTAYGANGTKYTGNVTLPTISQDSTTKVLSIS